MKNLSYLQKQEDITAYKKLFRSFKSKDIDQVNDQISTLCDKYHNPKLVKPKDLINVIFKKISSEDFTRVIKKRLKSFKFQKNRKEIAEIIIKEDEAQEQSTKRNRLEKNKANRNVLLDRCFKVDTTYIRDQNIKENIQSAILTTLMTMQIKNKIDDELLASLDFSSLVRLSLLKGGHQIQVPTYSEVEGIIASTYFFYFRQYEGLNEHDALRKVKEELGISLPAKTIRGLYNSLLHLYAKELYKDSTPIVESLKGILELIKTLQLRLEESTANIQSGEEFLKVYKEVNESFLLLGRGLSGLNNG